MKKLISLTHTASIRSIIALIKTVASIWLVFYILAKYGTNENVLMIIVGYVIGMTNSIDGTYFSSTYRKQNPNEPNKEQV